MQFRNSRRNRRSSLSHRRRVGAPLFKPGSAAFAVKLWLSAVSRSSVARCGPTRVRWRSRPVRSWTSPAVPDSAEAAMPGTRRPRTDPGEQPRLSQLAVANMGHQHVPGVKGPALALARAANSDTACSSLATTSCNSDRNVPPVSSIVGRMSWGCHVGGEERSHLVVVDQLVPRAKPAGRLAASKGQGGASGHGDRQGVPRLLP